MRLTGERAPMGALQMKLAAADLRPLRRAMTGQMGEALPMSVLATLAVEGSELSFKDLTGTIGHSSLRGGLTVDLSSPVAVGGDIEIDKADVAALLTTALGIATPAGGAAALWSPEPLAAGAFTELDGAVKFKLAQATIVPSLAVRDLKGVARWRRSELALENLDGVAAGGRLGGELAFRRNADGLSARGRFELAGADATAIVAPDTKPIDGRLTLKLEADGIGLSPLALIGSLHGGGTITLTGGHVAGLDETAFDAAIQVVDQGGAIKAPEIHAAVSAAMKNGLIPVSLTDAAVTITAGQARLANVTIRTPDGADLTLSGMLDLTDASLDMRLTLLGKPGVNALIDQRPELVVTLKGPFADPTRTIDVSALAGWLALRAADQQARRLEAMEANRREAVLSPVVRPPSPIVRFAPEGTSIESLLPANVAAAPSPSARGLDRLQPEPPPPPPSTPPSDARPNGSPDQGAERAPRLPAPIEIRPLFLQPLRPPPRAGNSPGASGETLAPQGQAPAPRPPAPVSAERPPLDLLFRPQN
jgi:large subunit ribosomal protein L24